MRDKVKHWETLHQCACDRADNLAKENAQLCDKIKQLENRIEFDQFEVRYIGIAPRDGCHRIRIINHYFNKEHEIKLTPKNGEVSIIHHETANGWDEE